MGSERLQQIEEIYHAALEISPENRVSFLDENCGDNSQLRDEVSSLLAFENKSESFLDNSVASLAAELFADQDGSQTLVGERIGHYLIKRLLGKGGMGEVYLADDTNLNREVALKFLPAELTHDSERLKRFEREAQTASGLNHPNILTVHQFESDHESRFIVTEFVKGKTLTEKLLPGRMAIEEILEVAIQIAAALAAAHEAGIVHRDIKPDNVMIRDDGFVKVLDFGIAKLIENIEPGSNTDPEKRLIHSQFKTNPGSVIGTADYMSPEQARGKAVDARADIFSFGALIFEMVTAQPPFTGETVNHTIVNVLEKEAPRVSQHLENCPDELERIIQKTLEKKPEDRFQSARELLLRLKKLRKRLEFEIELERSSQPNSTEDEKTRVFETDSIEKSVVGSAVNLSGNLSRLIGREDEIAEITKLLKDEHFQILTLTGIGGTGKTRLAQALAQKLGIDFPDGIYFVALASITDFRLVVPTIAQTLGVRESDEASTAKGLKEFFRGKRMLIILDNFEQVIEARNDLAEIINGAEKLKVITTSREILHLSSECEFPVSPLSIPLPESDISLPELSKYEAVEFFIERAKYAKPNFELTAENANSVAQICQRLEGMPLAIELAAARIKLFSPQAILSRLSNSLKLLTGGSVDLPERQKTMRGAIEWSYDLLDDAEKILMNRLSVFAGGFSLDSADVVTSADQYRESSGISKNSTADIYEGISSLLDKNLLIRRDLPDGEPRFRVLLVIREFTSEKLSESGEEYKIKHRHARYFAELAERCEPELQGRDAGEWLNKLSIEHENLRSAESWSAANDPEINLRLVSALQQFWLRRGFLAEGYDRSRQVVTADPKSKEPNLAVKIYGGISSLAWNMGKKAEAVSFARECLRLSRITGDKHLIVFSLHKLASAEFMQTNLEATQALVEEGIAIAREINDSYEIATLANLLGEIARIREDYETAQIHYEEVLGIAQTGSFEPLILLSMINLGAVTCVLGDYSRSRKLGQESLRLAHKLGDHLSLGYSFERIAALGVIGGAMEKAVRLKGSMDTIYEDTGYEVEEVDRIFLERYLKTAREAIGQNAFEAEYTAGRAMSIDSAISLASEVLGEIDFGGDSLDPSSHVEESVTQEISEAKTAIEDKTVKPQLDEAGADKPKHWFFSNGVFGVAVIFVLLAIAGYFGYVYFAGGSQVNSIAVLPFVNKTNNAEAEYLSDGIAETLINNLSQIPNLNVKARSSAFRYKDVDFDARKIGSDLNVEAILTGVLEQRGEQLILNLELIDTASESVLWGKRYEGNLSEIVELQSMVVLDVSNELHAKLSGTETARMDKNLTSNSEAYRFYLKGRFHWNKRNIEDFRVAIDYFEKAVESDPNYALAYSGLADTFALMPLYGNFRPREYMPKAKSAAQKALALDKDLAEAHASLGYIRGKYDFDSAEAEKEYKTAIRLKPGYATARQWYAEHLAFHGMTTQALDEISKALVYDPLSLTINRMKGNILLFSKRYDEAIRQLNLTAEMYPDSAIVKFNLGDVFSAKKMYPEAVNNYLDAFRLQGKPEVEIAKLQQSFEKGGWEGFWREHLEQVLDLRRGLLAAQTNAYVDSESLAFAYAAAGEKEKALEFLARGYEERDPDMITIKYSGAYDFLADDPRFRSIIRKLGLPE